MKFFQTQRIASEMFSVIDRFCLVYGSVSIYFIIFVGVGAFGRPIQAEVVFYYAVWNGLCCFSLLYYEMCFFNGSE